jgi:hypothetical protein
LHEKSNKVGLGNQITESESDDKKYEALCLENDELREVIRRQTAFVKADQISSNEIEFTINRKKLKT